MGSDEGFPRELSEPELTLLRLVLPADREGYGEYRRALNEWVVTGSRFDAEDCHILTPRGASPDVEDPPPPLVAIGVVKDPRGDVRVDVRELQPHQLEFGVAGPADRELLAKLDRLRQWTLSTWSPGLPCTDCGRALREVLMTTNSGRKLELVLCTKDERLWLYDDLKGMNIPLPVTGYYNELMFQAGIRDPERVLHPRRLFSDLGSLSDAVLTRAFEAYARTRHRIDLDEGLVVREESPASWLSRLGRRILGSRIPS